MRTHIYATEADDNPLDLIPLIECARSCNDAAHVIGIWIDASDDMSVSRRRAGADLLDHVCRGDHLVVPDVGTLAGPIRVFLKTLDHLVYTRGSTLHFIAEGFTFAVGGDAERMNELAEQAYRSWRVRRIREGVARWKADGGRTTGWASPGYRSFRNLFDIAEVVGRVIRRANNQISAVGLK